MSDRRRSPNAAYTSDLPPEHVERIRRWHEEGLRAARAEAGSDGRTFDYLCLTLYVPPQVQPIHAVSHLLGEAVLAEVCPGDRVLDMGTGCGVNGILAARAGAGMLALDVNPEAVRAARDNARRNGVADRLEVRLSDIFDAVDPASDGPFDVVVFDPPFRSGFSRAICSRWRRRPRLLGAHPVYARGTAAPVRPRTAPGVFRQLRRPQLSATTGRRGGVWNRGACPQDAGEGRLAG